MGVGKTVSNSRCFFVVFPLLGAFLPRAVPAGTPLSRPARGDQGGLAPLASLSGVRPHPPGGWVCPRCPQVSLAWEGFQPSS